MAESTIFNLLIGQENFPQIQYILKASTDELTLFVIIEYLNKIVLSEKEFDKINITDEIEYEKMNFLTSFLKEKALNSNKKLILNSCCNLISNLMRKLWMENINSEKPEKVLMKIYDDFFSPTVIYCFFSFFIYFNS